MTKVPIEPDLLRWARQRTGLSIDDLTGRFPRLANWERGEILPTLKQVEAFAKATHTPVGYLFLDAPPVEQIPIPDFRTMASEHVDQPSPDLLDTIYLCQQRQEWYRDSAWMAGERPLAFVGSVDRANAIEDTASRIRQALGFDLEARRACRTWAEALRMFIEQADDMGLLVHPGTRTGPYLAGADGSLE